MARIRQQACKFVAVVVDCVRARGPGQGMAEYAVILAGVGLVVIVSLFVLGDQTGHVIGRIEKSIASSQQSANPSPGGGFPSPGGGTP